ncbi:phosphatidate cytidylyltransferase [Candidatus Pelagibacter sp. Uisw_090]|uniref:phosphatidate cytidylyltransferase n=1 Tax=Candidatus Pelagibacter sp. Uisw_090 TaxID=3230993 RepID=UPI0039E94918
MISEFKKRIITSIFLTVLLFLMYLYSFILIISLIIITTIVWIEFYALISKIFKSSSFKDKFLRVALKAISLLYLSIMTFFIIVNQNSDNNIFILYSLLVAIVSDIGGFVFGKTFKGKKLTKISPKKTISGAIGSFIFSVMLIPLFINDLYEGNTFFLFFATLVISLTSQMGDLFISLIKRKAKVKDTSDLLPGHGGFLDRIDGIIFAIPAGIILFNIN